MKDDDDEPKDMDVDKDEKEKSETKQKDSKIKSETKQKEDSEVKSETKDKDNDVEMKDIDEKEEKKTEPSIEVLINPARVTWKQQELIVYSKTQRYKPVKEKLCPGVVMLQDTSPGEKEDIVTPKPPSVGIPGISDDEPDTPEPFIFTRF